MKRGVPPLQPELAALMAAGKKVPRQPEIVRARAVARARAAAADATTMAPAAGQRMLRPRMFAVAASVACLLVVGAAAAAAYRAWRWQPDLVAPSYRSSATLPAARVDVPAQAPPTAVVDVGATTRRARTAEHAATASPKRLPRAAVKESYAAEVELLARAQGAFERRDHAGSLVALGEHGRRFPNGRLAEQREALRVRSLAESGRRAEARHAAAAFASRFPRSVLLRRLQETQDPSK